MKILDWYIIKKFFSTFLFALLLFVVIAVTINVAEQIDLFINSQLGVIGVFIGYYLFFIPYIVTVLFPVLVFITVVLVTSRMAMNSEIIAIRASGVSYNRFLSPFLFCGIFLMVVHWSLFNYILPDANKVRIAFEQKYKKRNTNKDYFNALYLRSDDSTYVVFKNYATSIGQASPFYIDKVKDYQLKQRITGSRIVWDEHRKLWVAYNVQTKSNRDVNGGIVIVPQDSMLIRLSFTPKDAVLDDFLSEKLNRSELKEYIEKERVKGVNVTFLLLQSYKMDSTPFLVCILVLIAVMLSSKRIRGGSGVHIALGSLIMTSYIFLDRVSSIFAVKSNFPPLLAAWVPHILFAIVTLVVYQKNRSSAV